MGNHLGPNLGTTPGVSSSRSTAAAPPAILSAASGLWRPCLCGPSDSHLHVSVLPLTDSVPTFLLVYFQPPVLLKRGAFTVDSP